MTTEDTLASANCAHLGGARLSDTGMGDMGLGGAGMGAPTWSVATLPWRLAEVAVAGALAGVLMILAWLGPRPDLTTAVEHLFFWIKAAYPAVVALCGLASATLLARSQAGGVAALSLAGAVASAMLVAAGAQAGGLDAAGLSALLWPDGAICLGDILVIAAPMLALTLVGLRDIDLERPAPTGFACGLFCGGIAGTVNGLHCWQATFAFVGPWFTLALLISGGVGAGAVKLLARRRWLAAE